MRVFKARIGYTLVEMMVVMGIIAVLALLGAGALLSARDSSYLDDSTELVLSTIRETQNKAMAIVDAPDLSQNQNTKVWGIKLSQSSLDVLETVSYDKKNESGKLSSTEHPLDDNNYLSRLSSIEFGYIDGSELKHPLSDISDKLYISFNTPFARPSAIQTYTCTEGAKKKCAWKQSDDPSEQWEIGDVNTTYAISLFDKNNGGDPGNKVYIDLTFKNKTDRIIIKSNGESYIEHK